MVKEFWNKLDYWKKYGLVTFILGIIVYLVFVVYQYNLASRINDFRYLNQPGKYILPMILPLVIIPTILGSLFGILLKRISIQNKSLKYITILLLIILFLVILFFVDSYIINFIVKPY